MLNEPITSEEVENSLYRAKLNHAPVVDAIPAEDCKIRFALIYCIGLLTFVLKMALCQVGGIRELSGQSLNQTQIIQETPYATVVYA